MPYELAYVRVHGSRRGGSAPGKAKNASSLPTVAAANGHRALLLLLLIVKIFSSNCNEMPIAWGCAVFWHYFFAQLWWLRAKKTWTNYYIYTEVDQYFVMSAASENALKPWLE